MVNNYPKVSVIIAAYNLQDVIEKSIKSILNQTLTNIEVFICDDCSTDNTFEILKKLSMIDDRIILLRNDANMGQAFARNRCFLLAQGEYFAIHDGDDFSMPDRLRLQMEFLDNHPEYAFASNLISIFDDFGNVSEAKRGRAGEVGKRDFLWGMPFSHPATMFRGDCIKKAGGYTVLPSTRFRNEDYDLAMRIYAMGMKGYVLNALLYNYYEGIDAYKRRKYRYRWAEAKVRYKNFKALGLMPQGIAYVAKPMIVGLIPQKLIMKIRQNIGKNKQKWWQ